MINNITNKIVLQRIYAFTSTTLQATEFGPTINIRKTEKIEQNTFQFKNPFIQSNKLIEKQKQQQNLNSQLAQKQNSQYETNKINIEQDIFTNNNNNYTYSIDENNIYNNNIQQDKKIRISSEQKTRQIYNEDVIGDENSIQFVWNQLKVDALSRCKKENILEEFFYKNILQHNSFENALCYNIANKLGTHTLSSQEWYQICVQAFKDDKKLKESMKEDLLIIKNLDAGWVSHINSFLYQKGYSGLSMARVAQYLYKQNRKELAYLIQNRVSELYSMDIHPGSEFECGIFFDHASGLVIGETAKIGSGTYILHNVTLGASGKEPHGSDRHPKLGKNCYIGSNVSIIGNLQIGNNVKIGAGSVCLKDIPDNSTCVGIPAKILNLKK